MMQWTEQQHMDVSRHWRCGRRSRSSDCRAMHVVFPIEYEHVACSADRHVCPCFFMRVVCCCLLCLFGCCCCCCRVNIARCACIVVQLVAFPFPFPLPSRSRSRSPLALLMTAVYTFAGVDSSRHAISASYHQLHNTQTSNTHDGEWEHAATCQITRARHACDACNVCSVCVPLTWYDLPLCTCRHHLCFMRSCTCHTLHCALSFQCLDSVHHTCDAIGETVACDLDQIVHCSRHTQKHADVPTQTGLLDCSHVSDAAYTSACCVLSLTLAHR